MSQYIVYKDNDGSLSVIIPVQEYVTKYGINRIAEKDVPEGRPYKIVSASDLPSDLDFFEAWEIDDALLTDGIGSSSTTF
jgi:hypothetical protein